MHPAQRRRALCVALALAVALAVCGARADCTAAETTRYSSLSTPPASCCYTFAQDASQRFRSVVGEWEVPVSMDTLDVRLPHRLVAVKDAPGSLADASRCAVVGIHMYSHDANAWVRLETAPWEPLAVDADGYMHFRAPRAHQMAQLMLVDSTLLRADLQCDATRSCALLTMAFAWADAAPAADATRMDVHRVAIPERIMNAHQHECVRLVSTENMCIADGAPEPLTVAAFSPAPQPAPVREPEQPPVLVTLYRAALTLQHAPRDRAEHPASGDAQPRTISLDTHFEYCAECDPAPADTTLAAGRRGRAVFCDAAAALPAGDRSFPLHRSFALAGADAARTFFHAMWDGGGLCVLSANGGAAPAHAPAHTLALGFTQCEFYVDGDRYTLHHASVSPVAVYHDADAHAASLPIDAPACTASRDAHTRARSTKEHAPRPVVLMQRVPAQTS